VKKDSFEDLEEIRINIGDDKKPKKIVKHPKK